ncbi:MAG: 3-hydroxyacyl-CoA dehydrogenase family protein [Clostridium sp.]
MKKIGIIGAGIMGTGVAENLASSNYEVVLVDLSTEILEKSKFSISRNIKLRSLFSKDKSQNNDDIISKIKFTTDYNDLSDVQAVIENVTEDLEIKKDVYCKIDKICPKECIFLVNTSCISITKIGSYTNRAEKVIGTHFMNPVPMKKVVESIRGYYTSEETISMTKELLTNMGKEMILVNDYPGFVSNRLSHLLMNEAAFVVQDDVADPQSVDDIFKKGFGHKMGPLETADLIGLDTVVNSLQVLYESYQDPKFRCCPLLKKMVDAGKLGVKSGEGFYKYN